MENKILIYSPEITSRIEYIFDFVLNEFLGLDVKFTSDRDEFIQSVNPKINYSKEQFADEIHLVSDEFMSETGISGNVNFQSLNVPGKLFFALSRYEEYLPQQKDAHNRISGIGKVYKTPFTDEWILNFQKELKQKYPHLEFKKRTFEMVVTCDVDQTWKYKHKGFKRTLGAFAKNLVKFNLSESATRRNVISGKQADPYDTFDYFKELKEKYGFKMIFFWLMADYGKFDKNNPIENRPFQGKIKEASSWAEIGIHPSYASNCSIEKLKVEIQRLERISGAKITKSRQHYIKLNFPETYRNLIENGIQEDYTMAYADETGFRAGTCTPFHWYDLNKEEKTNLKVHPFCVMDVAMRNYMKLSPDEAKAEILRLKSEIQKVNGQMIVLFHNSNFAEDWKDWRNVLESLF